MLSMPPSLRTTAAVVVGAKPRTRQPASSARSRTCDSVTVLPFPAARERLPLQLREAKDRAPLGEVIAGAVHRQPRRALQFAGRTQTTRWHQTLLLPPRELDPCLARGAAPVPQ